MWQILAALWLAFSVLDLFLHKTRVWQLTTMLSTHVVLFVDTAFMLVAFITSDVAVLLLTGLSFVLQFPTLDLVFSKRKYAGAKPQLTLFNWNTQYWHSDERVLAEILKAHPSDVYQLQESWEPELIVHDVTDFVEKYFPGYQHAQTEDIVTITRFPILHVKKGTPSFPFGCWLRVDVGYKDTVLSLYNIHMPVPFHVQSIYNPVKFFKRWKKLQEGRSVMSAELEYDLAQNQNSIIMTGDFNTIKRQQPIRSMLKTWYDSANFGASILPVTLRAFHLLPLWRVDWLLSRGIKPVKYQRLPYNNISDHHPITTEFLLKEDEQ